MNDDDANEITDTSLEVAANFEFEPAPSKPSKLVVISIEQRIGQLLAEGESSVGIVEILLTDKYVETREEALTFLRAVYASWREIQDDSQLELLDLKNWHILMRHELLKKVMDSNPRAALAVLESMAELQKIKVALDSELDTIPIQIVLSPRIEKPIEEEEEETTIEIEIGADNDAAHEE